VKTVKTTYHGISKIDKQQSIASVTVIMLLAQLTLDTCNRLLVASRANDINDCYIQRDWQTPIENSDHHISKNIPETTTL